MANLTGTEGFFNKSKIVFTELLGNPKVITADTLTTLNYSGIDYLSNKEFTISSVQILKTPPRATQVVTPTVVTVVKSPSFTLGRTVTIDVVTSNSMFTLSDTAGLSIGDSITINSESQLVTNIDGLVVTTAPFSFLPTVNQSVTYTGTFSFPNEYSFSFTIASVDFATDMSMRINMVDGFNRLESILISLPKGV